MSQADLNSLEVNGVLFEANRQFFHPLGLDIAIDGDGLSIAETDDETGNVYDPEEVAELAPFIAEALEKFRTFRDRKHKARQDKYGYIEQPVGELQK